eukprot:921598-Alexandrium_andersonii.AAC.1
MFFVALASHDIQGLSKFGGLGAREELQGRPSGLFNACSLGALGPSSRNPASSTEMHEQPPGIADVWPSCMMDFAYGEGPGPFARCA